MDVPTTAGRVLVVDDEPPIVDLLTGYLAREGYGVTATGDGLRAVELARELAPDVVILDVMLPGLDGIEVCRRLRTFSDAYVLMLTARGEEIDRIMGRTVGADDYLAKPFSPAEVVARIKAMPAAACRRPDAAVRPKGWSWTRPADGPRGRRRWTSRRWSSTCSRCLARDPGVVVGRQAILDRVWGPEFVADEHWSTSHVANLRRKLGDDPGAPAVRGDGPRGSATGSGRRDAAAALAPRRPPGGVPRRCPPAALGRCVRRRRARGAGYFADAMGHSRGTRWARRLAQDTLVAFDDAMRRRCSRASVIAIATATIV